MATTYTPKEIVIESEHTDSITIANGQTLLAGAVLGKITASGEFVESLIASADGSEAPNTILLEDVDASAGAKTNVPILLAGAVIDTNLVIGAGHTIQTVKDALRPLGIFLKRIGA